MDKPNIFRSNQFHMDDGDVLHVLMKDFTVGNLTIDLVNSTTKAIEDSVEFFAPGSDVIEDIEGNVYHYITIGTQMWLVENWKCTKFVDGTDIPNLTLAADWIATTSSAYCWYDNDKDTNGHLGCLYNWHVVNDAHGIAPTGWRVPSVVDINTLVAFAGGAIVAGGKLKSVGYADWVTPNTSATDTYGFRGLPTGNRSNLSGGFIGKGSATYYWNTDFITPPLAGSIMRLYFSSAATLSSYIDAENGFSIRLMRDV